VWAGPAQETDTDVAGDALLGSGEVVALPELGYDPEIGQVQHAEVLSGRCEGALGIPAELALELDSDHDNILADQDVHGDQPRPVREDYLLGATRGQSQESEVIGHQTEVGRLASQVQS